MGGFNNVLKVDQSDVEVLKALDVDTASQKLRSAIPVESLSDNSYGQRIPDLSYQYTGGNNPMWTQFYPRNYFM